jgi:ribosomal protein S18 acetylase RimI-like enzyme
MSLEIRELRLEDYDEALALWQSAEGVTLRDADSREGIERYLARNPGLSFVAREGGTLVGAVLCGHDGRRGYLHHLAVAPAHRGRGIGRTLAHRCLEGLRAQGIAKCHLFLADGNEAARDFWRTVGWSARTDIALMSVTFGPSENA